MVQHLFASLLIYRSAMRGPAARQVPSEHGIGPNLFGVMGKGIAARPGTTMTVPGIEDPDRREALLDHLDSLA